MTVGHPTGAVERDMDDGFTLVIGNKNYSSWSLRPWLAMRQANIPFREALVPLSREESARAIANHSPSGKVPALKHGTRVIWDSLAILEYIAETVPEARLWPEDKEARAVARAVTAEMHSGFPALRHHMPMNLRKVLPGLGRGPGVEREIGRVCAIWRDCRERFGAPTGGGPFLFGPFTNADAMYAPVVTRFTTYAVELDDVCRAYCDAVLDLPALAEWYAAAREEPWVIEDEEVSG